MLSNATGCSDCSKNLLKGVFQHVESNFRNQICSLTTQAIRALKKLINFAKIHRIDLTQTSF